MRTRDTSCTHKRHFSCTHKRHSPCAHKTLPLYAQETLPLYAQETLSLYSQETLPLCAQDTPPSTHKRHFPCTHKRHSSYIPPELTRDTPPVLTETLPLIHLCIDAPASKASYRRGWMSTLDSMRIFQKKPMLSTIMRGFSPLQMYLFRAGSVIMYAMHCSYMDQLKPSPTHLSHASHITQEHIQ